MQWAGQSIEKLRTQIWQVMRIDNRSLSKQVKQTDDEKERKQLKVPDNEQAALAKSIKGSTYALGKAPENLTTLQTQLLALIAESHPKLYKAYQLKEELRLILKMPSETAGTCLNRWYWLENRGHQKEQAAKIMRNSDNILNTLRSGLSNARLKASNNKIKLLVRRSYGFRNRQSMFAYVKLICSKAEITLPDRPVLS